jgi:hypothetical protein
MLWFVFHLLMFFALGGDDIHANQSIRRGVIVQPKPPIYGRHGGGLL